jgi:hypothetical protein
MRWILLLAVAGCASSRSLEDARYNAQACESQRQLAASEAARIRATSISGSDDARAAQLADQERTTAMACAEWQAEVNRLEDRQERNRTNRAKAGQAFQSLGDGYRAAGTPAPRQPSYHCHTDYIGGMVCDPQ